MSPEIEKRPAGRGTAREQMLEKPVGIDLGRRGKFLREIDLVDVARSDVFLRLLHPLLEFRPRLVRLPLRGRSFIDRGIEKGAVLIPRRADLIFL